MPTFANRFVVPSPPIPRRVPRPRPWPTLPSRVQLQLAQQVAHLLRRVREEARHADRIR